MNTKQDYQYIRDANQPGWQDHWRQLLEGRFIVTPTRISEDQRAKIYRLGFTVAEVEAAIGHSGLTATETAFLAEHGDWHEVVDGRLVEKAGYGAYLATQELETRRAEIVAENKAACTGHILARYPLPVQSSANLGVYPAEIKTAMTDFIGRCIAEENRIFDLLVVAATVQDLEAIAKPKFPEV